MSSNYQAMGSYCHICDQFVENLDVCSRGEYHRDDYEPARPLEEQLEDDVIWYQNEIRTRSKSQCHRQSVVSTEVSKILYEVGDESDNFEKIILFEQILIIFKENKWILKDGNLSNLIISKLDSFSNYSPEFTHLKSFKYQLFGKC